jgi:hypothetical protein
LAVEQARNHDLRVSVEVIKQIKKDMSLLGEESSKGVVEEKTRFRSTQDPRIQSSGGITLEFCGLLFEMASCSCLSFCDLRRSLEVEIAADQLLIGVFFFK